LPSTTDETAIPKIFLPRFRDVDGESLCDGKSLVAIIDRLTGWMDCSILIHQIEMK